MFGSTNTPSVVFALAGNRDSICLKIPESLTIESLNISKTQGLNSFCSHCLWGSTIVLFGLSVTVLGNIFAAAWRMKFLWKPFLILASMVFSFFFSFITIKYFLIYIKKFSLNIFALYRVILGIFILFFRYL